MILKSLREKSNQKHINKLLNSHQPKVSDVKIESIGVLLNKSEFNDFEAFRDFSKELNIHPNKIKIVAFTEDDKDVEASRELLFSKKSIGWHAKIKSPELEDFLKKDFDALLCYYNENNVELDLATSLSKANFKIGISTHDERLFNFIIETKSKDFSIYKKELIKYLRILNKLKE